MATGSGKTFTAISFIYRLIKFAGARRVLFLVDRGNLGRQTKKEFDQYVSPYNNFKFGEEYIVQHLQSNQLDTTARVVHLHHPAHVLSMLKGRELPEGRRAFRGRLERCSPARAHRLQPGHPDRDLRHHRHRRSPPQHLQPVAPGAGVLRRLPDRPHRHAQQADLRLLQPEPGHGIRPRAGRGRRRQRQLRRLPHPHRSQRSRAAKVEAGYRVGYRDRPPQDDWQLDEDFAYDADRWTAPCRRPTRSAPWCAPSATSCTPRSSPAAPRCPRPWSSPRTTTTPRTIVEILREEFGKGNDFAQKITYRTTGDTPESLISAFRNSYFPRIAVTVDMIATGTDIKPVEIVMFMRAVKSRNFFEQMKGRGVRIIEPTDLRAVTPDARAKDHFVIVDCVGVCEQDKTDSAPMDAKKSVPFDKLLQAVALGNVEPEVLSSVAARLARLDRDLTPDNASRSSPPAAATA
jgi:type I restriction enzyme R subunit